VGTSSRRLRHSPPMMRNAPGGPLRVRLRRGLGDFAMQQT